MTQPVFSIILPTRNRARLLGRAIASVMRQSFTAYELLVIDDASTDATQEVVSAFADPRLRYIRLERNSGVSATRNAGICAAKGQFVSFLDDDDEYYPSFLGEMAAAFHDAPPEIGFAWCGARRVRYTSNGYETVRVQTWEHALNARRNRRPQDFRYLQVATSFGLTVRRSCFDVVGCFDEQLLAAVDTDLMFRLGSTYDYLIVPEILVTIHLHEGDQLTDKNQRRARAMDRLIENNIGVIAEHDDLWLRYHRGAAALHYRVGNRCRGRTMIVRALRREPRRWRTWKSWICYEVFGREDLGLRKRIPTFGSSSSRR